MPGVASTWLASNVIKFHERQQCCCIVENNLGAYVFNLIIKLVPEGST